MSSKKNYKRSGTLSFRLTLWYAVVFTFTSFVALGVFYFHIAAVTMENTDDELREEFQEFTLFMERGGREQVWDQLDFEAVEENDVLFRLLSAEGHVLKALNVDLFGRVGVSKTALNKLKSKGGSVIEAIGMPGDEYDLLMIYGMLGPDLIFNMGISLKDSEEYLAVLRNLIFLLMAPLFISAAVIGWLLARHAMKGVEDVTRIADEISKGSIEKRVHVKKRSYEIEQLADTFNHMLDRIQALIKSIQEMNDNIAHDLRSPLTRIRGIAEMTLISKDAIEDYREMAASTIEECDKLIGIINTMLEITETEAGVNSIETQSIDIVGLIVSACELFDPIAQEKDVEIITSLPDKLHINSNKNMLQRLVTNLLENAIKYNRQGGKVTISASRANQSVHIRFEDTGMGIPQKDIPKIFERFYRCDTIRHELGIGLGLSLVKAIVNALGGDIQVVSVMNEGSAFSVTLPA